jgi:uncharacterized membrane protein YraQ (UPF0718 family)
MLSDTLKKYWVHVLLLTVILILAVIAAARGGWQLTLEGIKSGLYILIKELPLLAAAFLTAGFLQALVKKEAISEWLGRDAGIKGILLACLGGGLIPGGPYAYYPIAGALLSSGAGLGVLVAFVTAKNLWSISRIPLEIAILGPNITIRRYLITFLIPPLLGLLVDKLFGGYINKVQESVQK